MEFLKYFLTLILATLGVFFGCGLTVHLIAKSFSALLGRSSGRLFDVTAPIGTPIHELGHAVMCKLFGHKIVKMKLWSPRAENGVYGYVNHSYSRRNLWARFGNLFIGMGPLFSGLGVTVFMLWLCFPSLWESYLEHSRGMIYASEILGEKLPLGEIWSGIWMLLRGSFDALRRDWLRSLLGLAVILPVSLHVSLSPQDVKASLGSLPVVLGMLALFSCATFWTPLRTTILASLWLFNLRLISLFALVIGFALVWLALALTVRLIRFVIGCF